MKNFNEIKVNDKIKIKDYILKVTSYDKKNNRYHLQGKKQGDYATYLTMLVTDDDYEKLDKISQLYCIQFSKIEVINNDI